MRPISLAVEHGWTIRALIHDSDRPFAVGSGLVAGAAKHRAGEHGAGASAELGEKDEPEVVAVVEMPTDDLERIKVGPDFLGVVFDRPTGPATSARSSGPPTRSALTA